MTLARVETQGTTLVVINANPTRRGALSPDLYAAIRKALEAAKNPSIRAIVIASEGGFFCSGGDLNTLAERRTLSLEERRARVQDLHDLISGIRNVPVPVIAAVEGGAAGAGLSLAMACDMIVASEGAKFTAAYVKAGVVPDGGLTSALARHIPRALASEMCLLARPVQAERFYALGAINAVVAADQVLPEAMSLAESFAKGPRAAQGIIKGLVGAAFETPEHDQLEAEREAMIRAVAADEAAIGISAFLDKRTPKYP